jgi:bifunctional non-homologous end joining protein LigD
MEIPTPIPLGRLAQPFDDPNWIYEIKHDGFRALAAIEDGRCRFFSRKKHRLTGFRDLGEAIVKERRLESAILDGELAATDGMGRTVFAALMQRSKVIRYFAFDLLWLNGEDLRSLPLHVRKGKLKRILPSRSRHLLYVDHTKGAGTELYRLACRLDLEGIVAKRADSLYDDNGRENWIKIKNLSELTSNSHQATETELIEITARAMEPATRIERATCGLRNSAKATSET